MLTYTDKFVLDRAYDACIKRLRESDNDAERVCTVQDGGNINLVLVVRGTKATEEILKAVEGVMDRWDKRKAKGAACERV